MSNEMTGCLFGEMKEIGRDGGGRGLI